MILIVFGSRSELVKKHVFIHPHNHSHMAAHTRNSNKMVAEHGVSQIVDVLVPPIMKEIVEVVKVVLQERNSERNS